jgi:hypothetical protein
MKLNGKIECRESNRNRFLGTQKKYQFKMGD